MATPIDHPPVALTIAGSDSSAGAGLQADLKTFAAHDVYGLCAVTSVVAEIPGKVVGWKAIDPELLRQQLEVLASGFPIAAVKTGMLANPLLVDVVCDFLESHRQDCPLVVDPVMVASSGDRLLVDEAIASYRSRLLPLAALATPNLAETAVLLDREIEAVSGMDMAMAAKAFSDRYGCPVLIKGGHWQSGDEAVDLLWDGKSVHRYSAPRMIGVDTHGTGCTLSAAIAANLARGLALPLAIEKAKHYITAAIEQAHVWTGEGAIRALNHFPEALG
ncbi:MAG: bifunctional hydroxymethylpyrimidine kinase/phosphomethylpyrimidine kinase [Verrucomicrobiae bacterium]|nr:bifunctional hydroxymethylpyrimidine kinase/phosphomethylpyrimidine kinase [Verrucomicrobiae bacterium]